MCATAQPPIGRLADSRELAIGSVRLSTVASKREGRPWCMSVFPPGIQPSRVSRCGLGMVNSYIKPFLHSLAYIK